MSRFDLRDLFRGRTAQERVDALRLRPDLARATVALVADERVNLQVVGLEALLGPDESVLMLVEGRYQRRMGLLMLSTRRVLFRPHGADRPATSVRLTEIAEPESETGSMTGRVVLRAGQVVLEVDKLLGKLAEQFAAAVRGQQHLSDEPAADLRAGRTPPDPLQELVDLRAQHIEGLISDAVYEAEKARLVREI